MLSLFKRNDISTAFALLFISIVLRLHAILFPPTLESIEHFTKGFFFNWSSLFSFYQAHPSLYIILSLIPFTAFAIYFNFIINREKIFFKKSYIPALAFMMYTSFLPMFAIFSTVFMANVFIFMAFATILNTYNEVAPQKKIFNAGLYISIATLFYFPSVLLTVLFLILVLIIRPLKLKEIIAYLLGCITPIYFFYAIQFLSNKKTTYFFHFQLPLKTISTPLFIYITIVSIIVLVYGLFLVNQSQGKNSNAVRKKWNCIGLYFLFATIVGAFSVVFPGNSWLIATTPFSIILSQSLQNHIEKYNNFTFYTLLISLLVIQWFLQLKYNL